MSVLTVPAAVIGRLREGTHLQLAEGAETIQRVASAWDKDDPPAGERALMQRAWALIDVLGWAGDVPESIDVDVREHGVALRAAIDNIVTSLTDVIADLPEGDAIRVERAEELQALREFEGAALRAIERERAEARIILVPADVAEQLRSALYHDLARAGNDLDTACSTKEPGDVASPVGKLRRLFALLDDIGWSKTPPSPEALTIDGRHLRVVVDTLEDDQEGWEWITEQPQLEDLPGRERAKAIAEMIERFLATLPTSPATLMIPPTLLVRVREGAYGLVGTASEDIEQSARACVEPEPKSRPKLEAAWGLLDAIGWNDEQDTGAITELTIIQHGATLLAAIEDILPLMAGWLDELDPADERRAERADESRLLRQLHAQVRRAVGKRDASRG
jgi:hypothetical protein